MKQNKKVTVPEALLLLDNEIFSGDGRLLAKCWREDVAEILFSRLNSQPALLKACGKARELLSNVIIPMGAKKPGTPIHDMIEELEAAAAKAKIPREIEGDSSNNQQ